jgi:hypothetical protein
MLFIYIYLWYCKSSLLAGTARKCSIFGGSATCNRRGVCQLLDGGGTDGNASAFVVADTWGLFAPVIELPVKHRRGVGCDHRADADV